MTRPPIAAWLYGSTGAVAFLATNVGLSGVGDTPDPHDTAVSTAAYFVAHRRDIFTAAGIGLVGALALAAATILLARRLRPGAPAEARWVAAAGVAVASYFASLHAVYVALAVQSFPAAQTAQRVFLSTIDATSVVGACALVMLGAAALGGRKARVLPRGWTWLTAAAALAVAPSVVARGHSGFFYADVQQQIVASVVLYWCLATAIVTVVTGRRATGRRDVGAGHGPGVRGGVDLGGRGHG